MSGAGAAAVHRDVVDHRQLRRRERTAKGGVGVANDDNERWTRLLEEIVYDLQMRFVRAAREGSA